MRYPSIAITLSVLESLFSNPTVCAEFPFIGYAKRTWSGSAAAPRTGCRGCGNRPNRHYRQHVLETVKAGLVGLPPERVDRLKKLLNTDKIVMHFAIRGKTVTQEL